MHFELDRRSIGGVKINKIIDPKFKTGAIYIRFLMPYEDETAPALSLIPALLVSANKHYDSNDKLSRRLNELYGASLSGVCLQCSDMLELLFSVDFILDKYAYDGESVAYECASLLGSCLFDPVVSNGEFDHAEFDIRKRDLLDAIDSEINDKASYALTRSFETVYRGETRSKRHYGSREAVAALTPKQTYQTYLRMLNEASVHITVCAGEDIPSVNNYLVDLFTNRTVSECPLPPYYSYSPCKAEPEFVSEYMDVKQANLVMAFKTDIHDYYINRVLSALYGESPISKLFMNVRERLSLCYYCQSVYSATKATMFVLSAVDNANVQKTKDEAVRQLSLIASGDFSDSDLELTKLYLVSLIRAKYDRKGALAEWFFSEELSGSNLTIEQAIDKINAVTREDVISAAKSYVLDTLFVLSNGKEAGDED